MVDNRIDPFTVEIVKESLTSIADEMFAVIQATAKSPIIYEALDFACGITDARGRLITQGNGLTGFLGVLTFSVQAVLEAVSDEEPLETGDVFIMNDPFGAGGTHQNDVVLVEPILLEGVGLAAFAVCKAHWSDVGGAVPGSLSADAVEGYAEGLIIPCVRLRRAGIPQVSVEELILANVRDPDTALGDINAQRACLSRARIRFIELCARYGHDTIDLSADALLDHGERMVRQELKKLPHGIFHATDVMDFAGADDGIHLQVKVTITAEKFICDFTGSDPQVAGSLNLTWPALVCAVRTVFKAVTGPHIDANEGCFRPLEIISPLGTVLSAKPRVGTSVYYEAQGHAADLVWKALAAVVPERLSAGHFLSPCVLIVAGDGAPDGPDPFLMVEFQAGGWGAGAGKDGESAMVSVGNGESYVNSLELTETRYGIRFVRYELAPGGPGVGAGRFRGGLGVVKEFEMLCDGTLTSTIGRHTTRPWSVDGGQLGSSNLVRVTRTTGEAVELGMAGNIALRAGDRVAMITGNGAGWGDPGLRPPHDVAADVRAGYITAEQAEADYGFTVATS
ncbi:hydantoinase B/oxoprolinase family protein (plasmid) [Rhodococcus qingshengii]|uniref:hydantoinase B/oxoprolinase family protein n=1 Tax=Rhodococcus qingshengii TaxID=334542 RepID=UPI00211180CA|nr:hydantoinase B/oxoprolinase family protein [Rhodococcus qingshengii]UUE28687.1 hydantoinase B/oxoprolinase family protein [Rhodococcus qingshengii]